MDSNLKLSISNTMAAFKHLGFTFLHLLNYISIVWMTAGLTIALMFLFGYYLFGSIVGGLMPVVSFPLRENYASPIGLSISVSTTLLIICWQFAQFMLFTQICGIFAIYILGVPPCDTMHTILVALMIGLLNAVALMFGNEMLFTSWLFSCLLATLVITLPLDSLCNYLPTIPRTITRVISFFSLTFATKVAIAKAFHVQDDAHVFELLKSKFTDFKAFHAFLYTCAIEFDFLGWEMPLKTTQTLLIPCAVLATFLFLYYYLHFVWKKFMNLEMTDKIDPASCYNILQMSTYSNIIVQRQIMGEYQLI